MTRIYSDEKVHGTAPLPFSTELSEPALTRVSEPASTHVSGPSRLHDSYSIHDLLNVVDL